ncbi:MAG: hypothetical protein DRO52_04870 [Candidatus Hecatellales archaeon]|nr:MAG: hypothetical protein DRO52_04870 [Candidatus Hecatellales archaeon]
MQKMIKDSFLHSSAILFLNFFEDEKYYVISAEGCLNFDFNRLSKQKTLAVLAAKIYLMEELNV